MNAMRWPSRTWIGTALILALLSPAALALPGDYDTTFDGGVFNVPTTSPCYGAQGNAVALQHDGRVLIGGHATIGANCDQSAWTLVRRNADGTPDTTFGGGTGQVNLQVGGVGVPGADWAGTTIGALNFLAVQSDGKIVGAGDAFDSTGHVFAVYILRWNSDGTLDSTFGSGGRAEADLGAEGSHPHALALQSDGKILVAFSAGLTSGGVQSGLARYTTSGSLDTGFGTGGVVILTVAVLSNVQQDLALQPDGRILLGSEQVPGRSPIVVRLTTSGALDTSFGTGGIAAVPTNRGNGSTWVRAVVPQPDGSIVGIANTTINACWLFRLRSNGDPDTHFGQQHLAYRRIARHCGSLLLTPTGSIRIYMGSIDRFDRVYGYTDNGAIDTAFVQAGGTTPGESIQPVTGNDADSVSELLMQPDGRLVVGGTFATRVDYLFARYEGDSLQLRPKTFTFASVGGVPASTLETSNAITIANLTASAQVPITVAGGSYSVNGRSYTTRLGYVTNGDVVRVEHTSSATSGGVVTTTLRVGGTNAPNAPWVINGSQVVAKFTTTTL